VNIHSFVLRNVSIYAVHDAQMHVVANVHALHGDVEHVCETCIAKTNEPHSEQLNTMCISVLVCCMVVVL